MAALTRDTVAQVYHQPLLELVYNAASTHRAHHGDASIQCASLLNIKTGGCPEDCAYCPQSARHDQPMTAEPLMALEDVITNARRAKQAGADRFCMGAAWREVRDNADFERVLDMVAEVKAIGLETCVTLGMLKPHQAERLHEAGLDYYNHNLDTSPEFYGHIISTRTYAARLQTLNAVREAGIKVCCGGIVGMGESDADRIGLLWQLAKQDPAPESVPINALVPVGNTPLSRRPPVDWQVMVRMCATARILMPSSYVRLSAGRESMPDSAQALCFLAGANSIFLGDKLLTTPNPKPDEDISMLADLGLTTQAAT